MRLHSISLKMFVMAQTNSLTQPRGWVSENPKDGRPLNFLKVLSDPKIPRESNLDAHKTRQEPLAAPACFSTSGSPVANSPVSWD